MQEIIWKVHLVSLPPVLRYCKKCRRKMNFISSGQFRANAQRKYLDIWLIYKCTECNTTWNATLFSRINPKSLTPEYLDRFHRNDPSLVNDYAMNVETLQRNGGVIGKPEYQVIGDDLSPGQTALLHIKADYPLNIKVAEILRNKLQISRRIFEEMLISGAIKSSGIQDLRKCELRGGIILNVRL